MWIISKNEISFNLKQLTKSINSIFVFFLRFFGKFVFLLKIFPIFLIFFQFTIVLKKISQSVVVCFENLLSMVWSGNNRTNSLIIVNQSQNERNEKQQETNEI